MSNELLSKIDRENLSIYYLDSGEPMSGVDRERLINLAKVGNEVFELKQIAEEKAIPGVPQIMNVIINRALLDGVMPDSTEKERESPWIPVRPSTMPGKGAQVLILTKRQIICDAEMLRHDSDGGGSFYLEYTQEIIDSSEVSHWTYRPALPEREGR